MPFDVVVGRNESDKKDFGGRGLAFIGKSFVTMGNYTSLSNPIFMDVARSHVVLISGKRGSGKSYTIGTIAESLSGLGVEESRNIAPLIFDTMGIFWTMKYKNMKDGELLASWDLEAKNVPVRVFAPFGYYQEYKDKGVEVDAEFAIKISELESADWVSLFELEFTDSVAVLLEFVIGKLKEPKVGGLKSEVSYGFDDIYDLIGKAENFSQDVKNSAIALFDAARTWKVFDEKKGTDVRDLVSAGTTTVIDLSMYASLGSFNVRALIIGLVSKKIFNERMVERKAEEIQAVQHGADYARYRVKREMPLVWIFIDECLSGSSQIITSKAHTPMQEVVEKFKGGEKFRVLGFDESQNKCRHYDVLDVYEKGERKVIKLISETGRELVCTPEHRVLTRDGFASAFSVDEIATPLIQHYSEDEDLIVARVLGHLYGDGWVSDKGKCLGFSGKGNRDDLEKIRRDLKKLGFRSSNVFERKTSSSVNHKDKVIKIEGTSQSFHSTSAYGFFREKVGFSGQKVLCSIGVPECILKGSVKEKVEFLGALMGADGQKITNAKNAGGDFNAIRFSFNKIESLEKEAFNYVNQIVGLFEDVGVRVSSVSKRVGNLRKDGHRTFKFVITLSKNVENTVRFLERVGYRYCYDKEREGVKWLAYLKARLFLKREREKVKDKALELHKKGLGKISISKELDFPEAQIRDWIYMGNSPGLPKTFLDYDEWIKNRVCGDLLFEYVFRIRECGKEKVFDMSVDGVHNFISNGFITHNCHEFLPREGKTPASDALIQILREGRQPGISMVMATQQPGKIHTDAMTQSDIVISHRVTAKLDVEALNDITQSYLYSSISDKLNGLPRLKGSAIILDDNSERIYPMRVRPRFTWHGGEAPTAIKKLDF